MDKSVLIGGLVLIVISIVILPRALSKYRTLSNGEVVTVKILKLPNCDNGFKNKFITVQYAGMNYILRTHCKYVKQYEVGSNIEMLHERNSNVFIFPNEDVKTELFANIGIGLLGLLTSIIALVGKRKRCTKG